MRLLSLVFFIPLLASVLRAQVPDNSPEDAIRDALDQKSDFYGRGIMDKQLSRMGDAAAVAITKVIAGKKIDQVIIDRLLVILKTAFSAPRIVESDRKPRAALFILQLVERLTSSSEQRGRILELRRELEQLKPA
ncbi:MAG: hypothetical protein DMG32_27085 [Acidobacteria bacterium]|nr:MAG: hypothetical protein DMG32_27085 [Acidobacteriota bacterium]